MPRSRNMGQIQAYIEQSNMSEEEKKIGDILAKGQGISAQDQIELDRAADVISNKKQVKQNLEDAEKAAKEQKRREKEGVLSKKRTYHAAADAISTIHDTASNVSNTVSDTASDAWNWLGSVPTPGSIFFPVSVLLVFWLLIFPVNGNTRMEWLFLAVTGQATIAGSTA